MRRIAHILAVTAAVAGLCLSAAPAGAGAAESRARNSGPGLTTGQLTTSQRQALAAAQRLQALRTGHGILMGLVRKPDGAPAPNVCVTASGPLGTRKTFTRPDGTYVIAGLRTGSYRVEYRGCSPVGKVTGQYYGGLTKAGAAKVTVTGAAPTRLAPVTLSTLTSRADQGTSKLQRPSRAQLAALNAAEVTSGQLPSMAAGRHAGHVSGRVTAARSGRPLAKMCVLAAERFGNSEYFVAQARTSTAGRYSLRLRPGRYYIDFLPLCAQHRNYAPQLWKSAESLAEAAKVHVTAGHTVAGIDAALGTGAQITGRIRTHAKSPHPSLGGVCVLAIGTRGQRLFEGFALTAKDGSFTLSSLATGTYRLVVSPDCGRSSVWLPAGHPVNVKVTDGKVTSGVTAWAVLGGAISGVVKDGNGKPLGGICVNAFGARSGAITATLANGTYRITGLAAGRYHIAAGPGCPNNGPYANVDLPNPVVVRPGVVTAHVNVTLPFDGTLNGVVKDAHGKPLGGVCVQAQGPDFAFGFATTRADGTYTVKKLSPGSYQVEFIPGGVFSDCGNNGNYLPVSDNASIASKATTTLDEVLPTGGAVSGTVTDPHGKPLGGVCVFSNSLYGEQVITKPDGSYRMDQLFSGSYFVGFEGGCGNQGSVAPQAYRGDPTFYGPASISVTQGSVTSGIDARMKPGATVAGRITNEAGQPISGVCVVMFGATGAGGGGNYGTRVVDRRGHFSAANLPPGQYQVFYSGQFKPRRGCARSPYADAEFSNQGVGAVPDLIMARAGRVTVGADAALALAGQISGVVTDRSGHVLRNMCVQASAKSGTGTSGFTNRHGTYTLHGLPPGRYKVEFTSCGGDFVFFGQTGLNYASQWYKDQPTERSATMVTVRPAETAGGIDAALRRGASVSGQVTYRPNGRPVPFVCVLALTSDQSQFPGFGVTDRRGHFLVDGLSTGQYTIEYAPCSSESALAGELKTNVHVITGQRKRGVSESLPLGGTISGVIAAKAGGRVRPAPGTCFEAIPVRGNAVGGFAISSQEGRYVATGVAPGRYRVLTGDPSCSSDAPALSARFAGRVTVASGKTTRASLMTLPITGTITGTVRGSGHALGGICAEAYQMDSSTGFPAPGIATGVTGRANGSFVIGDLQPGSYKVRFTTGCGASGYATRWYRNARTESGGRVIVVRAATVTSGIDGTLPRG